MRLVSGSETEGSLERRRAVEKLGKIVYEEENESRVENGEEDGEGRKAKRRSTQSDHGKG